MYFAFLESYNKIVSHVFLHFSEELIMSKCTNTQDEEKNLTFRRNVLDTFNASIVLVVF